MKILRWSSFVAAALMLVLGSGAASAAFLSFVEQGDDVVVQHDNNFECGITFTASGENAHVDACWITNSPNGYSGEGTAYMLEPSGSPNGGSISDRIHIQFDVDPNGFAHMVVDFISDSDTAPPEFPPPGVQGLVEDGTSQLINFFFFNSAGLPVPPPANIELRATSDVEPPIAVEPITWGGLKARF